MALKRLSIEPFLLACTIEVVLLCLSKSGLNAQAIHQRRAVTMDSVLRSINIVYGVKLHTKIHLSRTFAPTIEYEEKLAYLAN